MKKTIAILVLVILVGVGFLYFGGWVGEVPILEYKYKKGETLYYTEEGKQQAWGMGPKSWIKGPTVKSKSITGIKIKDITEKSEYEINEFGLVDTEGTGRFIGGEGTYYQKMSMKGDIEIRKEENTFFSSQPRFGEGRKRSWKKVISVSIDSVNIPARYKIIRKIWGEKDTYRIKTSWERVKVDNKGNKYSMRLKGYSDFDASEGRIIRMKTCFEGRVNGKLILKTDASWRLMSEEEIFKLSGLEKEWELVVPDAGNFDLSKDGNLVYKKGYSGEPGPLYISNGDGSQPVKIADESVMPIWSPDGKMIAYAREHIEGFEGNKKIRGKSYEYDLYAVDLENKKEHLLYEKINTPFLHRWSPDSRWIGFYVRVGKKYEESELITVNVETKEVKKIEKDNYPLWYIDIHFSDKDGKQIEKENIVRWSPDGKCLAVGKYKPGLFIVSRDTINEEVLIKSDSDNQRYTPLAWSRDGRFIVFEYEDMTGEIDKSSYHIYSLDKRKVMTEIISEKAAAGGGPFLWSYNGEYLYFCSTSLLPGGNRGIFRLKVPDEIAKKISMKIDK